MSVLAIETATIICSTAVVEHQAVRAGGSLSEPRIHSEKLITLIDNTLSAAGISVDELDAIAVSIGPGSFTGLRIGLSVAKGLAYAKGKTIVAVPTLEALAWNAVVQNLVQKHAYILPLIDARRQDVYCSLYYYSGGNIIEQVPARAVAPADIKGIVGNAERVTVMGDGASKFMQFLSTADAAYRQRFRFPEVKQRVSGAVPVGILGEQKLKQGVWEDLALLEPVYIKDFYTLVKTQHQSVH